MNIYGDTGNTTIVFERMRRRNLECEIVHYNIGDNLQSIGGIDGVDIILAGGGQDAAQKDVANDLQKIKTYLKDRVEDNVPMLSICGTYQLCGKYFQTSDNTHIEGISIFDAITIGKSERLIGNVVAKSAKFGHLVGYENHSGQTYLQNATTPLSETVELGVGNSSEAPGEGAIYKNAIGTYLHGPVLSKNPRLADFLITQALMRKYACSESEASALLGINTQPNGNLLSITELNALAEKARQIALSLKR
jgi:CobQ-like glutamine amidotransferase family enzyme